MNLELFLNFITKTHPSVFSHTFQAEDWFCTPSIIVWTWWLWWQGVKVMRKKKKVTVISLLF